MKSPFYTLSVKNLAKRPARTAALMLLTAFLSLSVFGGSVVVGSLQNGLRSYEARLGADIVVTPNEARSHGTLESILLQGIPGYFYMDASYLEKIAAREGVESVSPQFFLASASAGCCSVAVQIIGFDPATDFSIQPWIKESYAGGIGDGDLIVGSNITVPANRILKFYNMECRVAAKLDETGTGLDNAVYANMNTIRQMMEFSRREGFRYYDGDAQRAISSVMVRVTDGYDIGRVTDDINIHVRKVKATQAKSMISGIAGGLSGISHMVGALILMIWILSIAILTVVFVLIVHERKREFAVLRVVGASGKMLSRLLWTESAMVSAAGALCGAAAACLLIVPFSGLIRTTLELPYLLPGAGTVVALFAGAVLISVLAGALASAAAARGMMKNGTDALLRES